MDNEEQPIQVAIIAGEASGDVLGGALIAALRQRFPDIVCQGVVGPRMREAGCEALASIDALSVMGIAEVLPKIPSIIALRERLFAQLRSARPDCVIGIDAPDFNLPLERRLRAEGIPVVHMVSPSVWAWRPGRVKGIARAVDRMLCLLPFEPDFYAGHGVQADYIGHPLAEQLAQPISREEARARLGLQDAGQILAVLPGSRGGELRYLASPFARTAGRLAATRPGLAIVTPLAKPSLRAGLEQAIGRYAPGARWRLVDGDSQTAMRAADVVLLASGTATLECLLLDRPMVVAYKVSAATAYLLRQLRLLKVDHVSLPNLLCERPVVEEFLQERATPEALATAVATLLDDPGAIRRQLDAFAPVRSLLRRDAAAQAARIIGEVIDELAVGGALAPNEPDP